MRRKQYVYLPVLLMVLIISGFAIGDHSKIWAQNDDQNSCTAEDIRTILLDVQSELGQITSGSAENMTAHIDHAIALLQQLRQNCVSDDGQTYAAPLESQTQELVIDAIDAENVSQIEQQKVFDDYSSVAVSPDGTIVALNNHITQEIIILDTATGAELNTLSGYCSDMIMLQPTVASSENQSSASAFVPPPVQSETLGETVLISRSGGGHEDSNLLQTARTILVCAASHPSDPTGGALYIWDVEQGSQLVVLEQGFSLLGVFADLSLSHNGMMLAIADGLTAQVWNTNTWQKLAEFPIGDIGSSVSFSPDDRLLVGASWDGSVHVWDLQNGSTRFLLNHYNTVERAIFSVDGSVVFTAESNSNYNNTNAIHVWDANRGVEIEAIEHPEPLEDIDVSDDGSLLASITNSCEWGEENGSSTLRFWHARTYQPVFETKLEGICADSIEFAASSKYLLVSNEMCSDECYVALWGLPQDDIQSVQEPFSVNTPAGQDMDARAAAQATRSVYQTQTATLWTPTQTLTPTLTLTPTVTPTYTPTPDIQASIEAEMTQLYFEDATATATLWTSTPTATPDGIWFNQLHLLDGHNGGIQSIAYSPNGTTIATGSDDGTARLWDTNTGINVHTLQVMDEGSIRSIAFDPDGRRLALSGDYGLVELWSVETGELLSSFEAHRGSVNALAFSPDGLLLATAGDDYKVHLWDIASGSVINTLSGRWPVPSVTFLPDGQSLAVGDTTGIRLWEVATGLASEPLEISVGQVHSAVVSPDGYLLALGGSDHTVKLWDLETGRIMHVLEGHGDSVSSTAFHPNGNFLISGSEDATVRIWNISTGEELTLYAIESGTVLSVAFNPDGRSFAVGSSDGSVRLWGIEQLDNQ